jgi:hypothetical protein
VAALAGAPGDAGAQRIVARGAGVEQAPPALDHAAWPRSRAPRIAS